MSWETELDKAVGEYLPQLRLAAQEPMSRHTSFRIGGPAKRMAFPDSAEQLVLLVQLVPVEVVVEEEVVAAVEELLLFLLQEVFVLYSP